VTFISMLGLFLLIRWDSRKRRSRAKSRLDCSRKAPAPAPTLVGAGRGRAANPPTLLTRFAEELRRAPVAGGGRGIFDVGFLIFDYL